MVNLITVPMLQDLRACEQAIEELKEYFKEKNIASTSLENLIEEIISRDLFPWGNWLLTRLFTRSAAVAYAAYSARRVLHIYEIAYPDDMRPRHAIEAAEAYLDRIITTADAAKAADDAAEAATTAGYAARYAISHAAYSACAAAETTGRAIPAAYADRASYANYADPSAYAAANAVYASDTPDSRLIMSEILHFGLLLIKLMRCEKRKTPLVRGSDDVVMGGIC